MPVPDGGREAGRSPGRLYYFLACVAAVPSRLATAIAILAVGIVADAGSTYVAIAGGDYVEGSPVGSLLIDRFGLVSGVLLTKAAGMVVIGIPVAVAGGTQRLVATVMCAGAGVVSIGAAARNLLLVAGYWPL